MVLPCLVLGLATGLLAGLLGVGGGLVIVPALMLLFEYHGWPAQHIPHLAIGTSLATIVVTSVAALRTHHHHGAILWPVVIRLSPGLIAGTAGGAALAVHLDSELLRWVVAVFAVLVSLQMMLNIRPPAGRPLPGATGLAGIGAGIGAVSALVGIGGGSLTTPFLVWCNQPLRQAIATSAAGGLPIALAGAAAYLLAGLGTTGLPAFSSGYLYWPAFAGIAIGSMITAGLGARLTHRLPVTVLKRVFAVLLLGVALRLVWP
ncbi:MAG: sulfite exporter TauE/SafE family protein [Gammaproteobacteria bacterium]|nr:sulfite exporter TauE/SafE family protein [Gammaproteobacteria bacterium]